MKHAERQSELSSDSPKSKKSQFFPPIVLRRNVKHSARLRIPPAYGALKRSKRCDTASANRLRFRKISKVHAEIKKRKVHQNVSHSENHGCCARRYGVGYRGFRLVRTERSAYFIAIPGPQSQQGHGHTQHEGRQKRPDA